MIYPYNLEFELFFENEKKAKIALCAVQVELGQKHEKRSITFMNINKNIVLLKIMAQDSSALKASLNSYLKLLNLSENLLEVY